MLMIIEKWGKGQSLKVAHIRAQWPSGYTKGREHFDRQSDCGLLEKSW